MQKMNIAEQHLQQVQLAIKLFRPEWFTKMCDITCRETCKSNSNYPSYGCNFGYPKNNLKFSTQFYSKKIYRCKKPYCRKDNKKVGNNKCRSRNYFKNCVYKLSENQLLPQWKRSRNKKHCPAS